MTDAKPDVGALVARLSDWDDDDWHEDRGPFSHHKDIQIEAANALLALAAENERLNKWADGMTDAAMKERATAEAYQRELRAENERLKERLELGYGFVDGKRVPIPEDFATDGIASRDATIRLLDERVVRNLASLCYVDGVLREAVPGMDEGAPIEAIARKVKAEIARLTQERDAWKDASERRMEERDHAMLREDTLYFEVIEYLESGKKPEKASRALAIYDAIKADRDRLREENARLAGEVALLKDRIAAREHDDRQELPR